jgi:hypothetical protein
MWKIESTASSAVLFGTADWLNATARTKRDGGVKSPGRPSMPAPEPKALRVMGPTLAESTSFTERLM